ALTGFVSSATAGEFELPDFPILRGSGPDVPSPYVPAPPTFIRWSGYYGGAQIGYSRAEVDFKTAVAPLVHEILRNTTIESEVASWVLLTRGDTRSYSAGGFLGYNTQWDDAILGVEASYNHTALHKAAAS